ncbi:MAG TPA: cytochrome P450 [Blastocatellia bacterium]|nr:cytochrome P450 [Blastocatellia bacterium]
MTNANAKLAPTLRGGLLLGNMTALQRDPLRFNPKVTNQLGHVARVRAFPGIYLYLVTHPRDVEHVLQTNQHNYRKPDLFFKPVSLLAGKGILTSEGDLWLRQRRLIQPAFHRSKLATLVGLMAESAQSVAEAIRTRAKQNAAIDVSFEMMRLTLKVVSVALFSTDISGDADRLGHAVRETFEHVSYRMNHALALPESVPTPRNRRFKAARLLLDEMVFGLINRRRQTEDDNGDLLSMLLAARDEDTGERMSDQQLRDEVMTLILAGHETTGAALSWTWYLLSQNPEARNKLHAELDQILNGRAPGLEDLDRLPYSRMVFAESMRLYPPAWGLPREAIADDTLGGYHIPAGSLINLSQWVTQRHPDFWEKPERFDPERFTPERSEGRPRFAYFPFGGGARQCIGNNFALMEAQVGLATLAQRFTLDLVPGHPVDPDPTFTLRPRHGMMMTIKER